MGVVYSTSSEDIGELTCVISSMTVKAQFRLDTFNNADTNEIVQRIYIQFGKGLNRQDIELNYSEIQDLKRAILMIQNNNKLRYIAKTANMRLKWGTSMLEIDAVAEGSVPGDFRFTAIAYVEPEKFIQMLETIEEAGRKYNSN